MTIEFKKDRYFVGMWYGDFEGGNYLGTMYRDEGESQWIHKFRFRHFVDDKFGPASEDIRNWYEGKLSDRQAMLDIINKTTAAMEFDVTYLSIEEDGQAWLERDITPPWFGVSKVIQADEKDPDWESGWEEVKHDH